MRRFVLALAFGVACQLAAAVGPKLGLQIAVDGEGAFWNPVVKRIDVTGVAAGSLAAQAGIVQGDQIVSIEGQPVEGRRANALKAYLDFGPGQARTLVLKHADGTSFEARLTRPAQSPSP